MLLGEVREELNLCNVLIMEVGVGVMTAGTGGRTPLSVCPLCGCMQW